MVYELGTIIGMGLSGFILAYTGTKGTLLIGGISFIIASLLNFAMKVSKTQESESQNQKNWWKIIYRHFIILDRNQLFLCLI
ncbi:hypothetical protein [Bartonella koehlerae]|uniref:Uncharacterized protein n=1 Tax=Bartonella koehlerae C-29 TaxID=1134510 RepID=A0A067W7B9_9HYPH|nr:hypothetical protein [Bartonella koehlerae]KEC55880.1 hypothetical protein O9A_00435 [Bartonella koehlerae C-29]